VARANDFGKSFLKVNSWVSQNPYGYLQQEFVNEPPLENARYGSGGAATTGYVDPKKS